MIPGPVPEHKRQPEHERTMASAGIRAHDVAERHQPPLRVSSSLPTPPERGGRSYERRAMDRAPLRNAHISSYAYDCADSTRSVKEGLRENPLFLYDLPPHSRLQAPPNDLAESPAGMCKIRSARPVMGQAACLPYVSARARVVEGKPRAVGMQALAACPT